tara:strand:- start:330 stop:629 length:300 start_codon:yes stop_codon:yes gene_type:complete
MFTETKEHSIIEAYYNYAKIINYGDTYKFSSDSRTITFHLEGRRIAFTVGGKRHRMWKDNPNIRISKKMIEKLSLMPYFLSQKPKSIVISRALLMEKIN